MLKNQKLHQQMLIQQEMMAQQQMMAAHSKLELIKYK